MIRRRETRGRNTGDRNRTVKTWRNQAQNRTQAHEGKAGLTFKPSKRTNLPALFLLPQTPSSKYQDYLSVGQDITVLSTNRKLADPILVSI